MNIEYAAVMRRFSSLGWVSIWDKSQPSVWLTAYCIRIFEKVSFQDWEDFIYIDPMVFGSSVMWLLNYQSEEGSFSETEHFPHPLHSIYRCLYQLPRRILPHLVFLRVFQPHLNYPHLYQQHKHRQLHPRLPCAKHLIQLLGLIEKYRNLLISTSFIVEVLVTTFLQHLEF